MTYTYIEPSCTWQTNTLAVVGIDHNEINTLSTFFSRSSSNIQSVCSFPSLSLAFRSMQAKKRINSICVHICAQFWACTCTTQCRWSLSHVRVRVHFSVRMPVLVRVRVRLSVYVFSFVPLKRNDFVAIPHFQKLSNRRMSKKKNTKHLKNNVHI